MAVGSRSVGAARSWAAPKRRNRSASETSRLRVLWLMVVALILAAAIWGRLAYWQIARHESLSEQAAQYHRVAVTLPATRGMIYDRDGHPLAVNTVVYDVSLAPAEIRAAETRQRVADGVSGALGVPRGHVMDVLRSGQQFAYIARRQPKERADRLRAMNLPGVGLTPQQDRTYLPGGTGDATLASSLLGFVDYAGHGQRGIEQRYNDELAGRSGALVSYQDSLGREIALGEKTRRDPMNGSDVVLTIDSSIQYVAEQAIADGVKAAKAESGSVLVMDSSTGEIAAWASYPAYDANAFPAADPLRFRDPIVSDLYEPGSVMKVVTLAGAIDQGRIGPSTTIQDPGYVVVGGQVLRDWDLTSHGTVTMTNVLEKSLNVGAVRAMQAEGPDAFVHYLDTFGMGRPSGVDVADESSVPLRPLGKWRPAELATATYGQGIAVNMVQMCAAVNAIANGGRLVQPFVVAKVGARPTTRPAPRQAVSPQTAAAMTRMMQSVVQNGSGWTARVQGFEQDEAGKTGTSQIPENGGYSADHVWASYVGFLPASHPRFTMLVVVRRPDSGSADHNEGYYVSGPIWKRIAEQIIPEWRITPGPPAPSN